VDARDVAGDASITARRIGMAANIVNRSACTRVLVQLVRFVLV
jgi:hypothetical protein